MTRSIEEPRAREAAVTPDPDPVIEVKSEIAQEWELVRRAQQYDEDAVRILYETYYPKIYNYSFMQLGDVHAAEDLASDVMLKMIESVHTFKFRGLPFGA